MVKSGDDSARLGWKECVLLKFLFGLRIRYTWLQGDKHYLKIGSHNGKLGRHNGDEYDFCKWSKIFQQQRDDLEVRKLKEVG